MSVLPKKIQDFMAKYGIDHDEVWEIKQGRGAFAIKHYALERIAAEQGITFEVPQFAEKDGAQKNVAMMVVGHMGDRMEWSIGEASPHNYRTTEKMAAYPYAMAEKRAKDRVILKLLNTHGTVYSEEEADDFKRSGTYVTRPEDIGPPTEYDEQGHPIDNIPLGDDRIERLPRAKARNDYAAAQAELYAIKDPAKLKAWGEANANRIASYPTDWQEIIRGQYTQHRDQLRKETRAA
jgi:hypothetical protein